MRNQEGVIHLFIPILILAVATLVIGANIPVFEKFSDGSAVQGVQLAKGDNKGNSESEDESEDSRSDSEDRRGSSEEVRLKQEIRTSDERIKTEIREDRVRVEVRQENVKTKIQQKENEILIKTEIESEDENEATEAGDEDEATESADEDEPVQELRAISKFPLRIDTATNQLILTKNGVERVLTILPAHAVQNMLRAYLKKGLGPKFFQGYSPSSTPSASPSASSSAEPSATPSGEPISTPSASPTEEPIATESAEITILESQITLEEKDGRVVYKIPAKKHLKILGLIPVDVNLTGFISADSGELLGEQRSILARILDFLSP